MQGSGTLPENLDKVGHSPDKEYKQIVIAKNLNHSKLGENLLGNIKLSKPDQLIDTDISLSFNNSDKINILYVPGHSPDSLVVYHSNSKTLFAGDVLFKKPTNPTIPQENIDEKIHKQQLERLLKLDIKTIVSEHGPLLNKSDLIKYLADWEAL